MCKALCGAYQVADVKYVKGKVCHRVLVCKVTPAAQGTSALHFALTVEQRWQAELYNSPRLLWTKADIRVLQRDPAQVPHCRVNSVTKQLGGFREIQYAKTIVGLRNCMHKEAAACCSSVCALSLTC